MVLVPLLILMLELNVLASVISLAVARACKPNLLIMQMSACIIWGVPILDVKFERAVKLFLKQRVSVQPYTQSGVVHLCNR